MAARLSVVHQLGIDWQALWRASLDRDVVERGVLSVGPLS